MREFDLYESRNFSGGEYACSFEAETIEQFNRELIDNWHSSGLHRSTGEIFLYTKIDLGDKTYNFQVGYYCLEDDGQIRALFNTPDKDMIEYQLCESLGIVIDPADEEKTFVNLVNALIK